MRFGFYTYPWSIHDAQGAVARLHDLGCDRIALAASYHAGKFIQPGDPAGRVYFPEDGAAYFQPHGRYDLLKPRLAASTAEHDVLGALSTHGGVTVDAWIVLNHNSRLGLGHLDVVARNCFGDAYPYSLCPAHPAVRAYDVTLCRDIADGYDIDSILLETPGWLTYAHGYHHEFAQIAPNRWLEAMLGLCFCEACRSGLSAVGLNGGAIARRLVTAIDACLASETPWDTERQAEEIAFWQSELAAYHAWRAMVVTSLVRDIRTAVRSDVAVKVIGTTQRSHIAAHLEGHDLAALCRVADGLELPLYQSTVEATAREFDHAIQVTGGAAPLSAILRPGYPDMSSEAQLEATVALLRERGVSDVAFYNFAMLPPANLRWVERLTARRSVEQ